MAKRARTAEHLFASSGSFQSMYLHVRPRKNNDRSNIERGENTQHWHGEDSQREQVSLNKCLHYVSLPLSAKYNTEVGRAKLFRMLTFSSSHIGCLNDIPLLYQKHLLT